MNFASIPLYGRNTNTWAAHQEYVSEALSVLAQLVDQALEQQKPKPRGRPGKQAS